MSFIQIVDSYIEEKIRLFLTRLSDDKEAQEKFQNILLPLASGVIKLWLGLSALGVLFVASGAAEKIGQFGDLFGSLNALFSGLAFLGLIAALMLQTAELRLQRQELSDTRDELKGQKDALKHQHAQNRYSVLVQRLDQTRFTTQGRVSTDREATGHSYWLFAYGSAFYVHSRRQHEVGVIALDSKTFLRLMDSPWRTFVSSLEAIFLLADEQDELMKKAMLAPVIGSLTQLERKLIALFALASKDGLSLAVLLNNEKSFDDLVIDEYYTKEFHSELKNKLSQ